MYTDCVNTVVLTLQQIKHLKFFLGHWYTQGYALKFSIQMNFDTDLNLKTNFQYKIFMTSL